ncbi:unnamed protein product [Phytophthora fragariaefolia]|uniref:Unnamed protein product n=1 Tax=Phytophthora fragariaefolia TaxID=1490495 RepID=A0A9W6XN24_9STRA|nr:unnamed protein product [Phytophthora fragariaefolia]
MPLSRTSSSLIQKLRYYQTGYPSFHTSSTCKHSRSVLILLRGAYSNLKMDSHIEGDFTSRRLTTVPDGIFDNMPHLTFLHMGGIPNVTKLPSLSSLKSLRYLTLAVLDSLQELPSFDGLAAVSGLTIVNAPRVLTLPSLSPLVSLSSLGIRPKSAVCCNGFISGTCDLTLAQCLPVASDKFTLSCTDLRISNEDKKTIDSYGSTVCPNVASVDREATAPSKYTTDELCGGVPYKNCTLSGVQGICYNTRMMVINCETSSGFVDMRKLQIQRGVGEPCDPDVEAWLGCKS